MPDGYYQQNRHGRTAFASRQAKKRAGLYNTADPTFLHYGFDGRHRQGHPGDGHQLVLGGAGTGKLASYLSHQCLTDPKRGMWLDLKNDFTAIFTLSQTLMGKELYAWAPHPLQGMPATSSCNPLDHLSIDSPTLIEDCQYTSTHIRPEVQESGNSAFFAKSARSTYSALNLFLVERTGGTSFPELYDLATIFRSGGEMITTQDEDGTTRQYDECNKLFAFMLQSRFAEVRAWAGEMSKKRGESPKEYQGVVGEIRNDLAALASPAVRDSLRRDADFSLSVLARMGGPEAVVSLGPPAEYAGMWDVILRSFFSTAALYRSRNPHAPQMVNLIDEAIRLAAPGGNGSTPLIQYLYEYGRGFGGRTVSVWQSPEQMPERQLTTLMDCSACVSVLAARSLATANMASELAGQFTLLHQERARRAEAVMHGRQARRARLRGELDSRDAMEQARLHAIQAVQPEYMARDLMTPREIMNMPASKMLAFLNGFNLEGPDLCDRWNYWQLPQYAGRFLDSPYVEAGFVSVRTRSGTRKRAVIEEEVPRRFAHLPQYRGGTWKYVEGYRPRSRRWWF